MGVSNMESINYNISHVSLSWLSCRSSVLVKLKFGDVGFCGGRKTREPKVQLAEQGTGSELKLGHIGQRQALSPLRHPLLAVNFTANY